MSFEFARNIQDKAVNPAAFALPAAASASTHSTVIDFGLEAFKPENLELELSIPALSTVIVPDTKTVTGIIETSTDPAFGSVDQVLLSQVSTGAGGTGVAAFLERVRLPSNCARYVRFTVTFGALTTDGSAIKATGTVRF